MRIFRPLAVILVFGLLAGGCSFFRRDLKSSNESAETGGGAIAQKDSTAEMGPSDGVVGLEKAREDSFDWNDQSNDLAAKSAPVRDTPLPPRNPDEQGVSEAQGEPTNTKANDIWTEPGGSPSPKGVAGQVADAMAAPSIVGPAIEPSPTGKPLSQGPTGDSTFADPQPLTSTNPITQTSPLGASPEGNSNQRTDSLTLRSSTPPPPGVNDPPGDLQSLVDSTSSPGFQTISEDASQSQYSLQSQPPRTSSLDDLSRETDKQAANLARAIRPSALSGENDPTTTVSSTAPATGFQPLNPKTAPGQPNGSPLGENGPSTTEIPAVGKQSTPEPERNLLAMATDGKVSSDLSSSSPAGNPSSPPASLPNARTLKEQGIQQYKSKQFDQAIMSFKQYLSAYPDEDQDIQWRLAQSLFLANRWGEAEKEWDKLLGSPRPEKRADAILKLGMIDQKRGNMEGAREKWQRVVADYPKTPAAPRASELLAGSP